MEPSYYPILQQKLNQNLALLQICKVNIDQEIKLSNKKIT